MAVNAINIDKYLKRQQEIFNAYIEANGKEVSILPFIESYSKEDNEEYTKENIFNYLNSYIKSNQISESDKEKYNQTRLVSNSLIFKRGRIITEVLIENQGSFDILPKYQAHFAKKDGKLEPYSQKYLLKCRDYYLSHTDNKGILLSYQKVVELANRGNYDVELLTKILEIPDNKSAIDFIRRINISKLSLKTLIDEYKTIYPANQKSIDRLNKIYKKAFKVEPKVVKFIEYKENRDTLENKLITLRRILEEYLMSDIEDINEIFPKYNYNEYKFNEIIKDAKTGSDIILNNLINKYYAKVLSITNSYKELIEAIMQAKYNGINYGYGYREFNIYDYYTLKNGASSNTLLAFAKKIYNQDDFLKVKDIINEYNQDDLKLSKDKLREEISNKNENTDLILDYLEYAKLPFTKDMYEAVLDRFENKDITFEIEENVKVVNI